MKETDFLLKNIICHRGFFDNVSIPENSMAAFIKAIRHNYSIELDIHILKDNNIVVFHDDNLKRMTGINKDLKDCTYNEIKKYNLLNTNEKIPLLKDVLKKVDGRVPLLIEYKYDTKFGLLEKNTFKILKKYSGKYAIQSFNPKTIYWFKKNYPDIIRGQLVSDYKKSNIHSLKRYILKNMLFNFFTKPDFVSYNINLVPNKKVEKFRKKRLVLFWTIKNKEDLVKAKCYGDNYICENIENLSL